MFGAPFWTRGIYRRGPMEKTCEERIAEITQGFEACRNAFTAIGDETRQLILLVLL